MTVPIPGKSAYLDRGGAESGTERWPEPYARVVTPEEGDGRTAGMLILFGDRLSLHTQEIVHEPVGQRTGCRPRMMADMSAEGGAPLTEGAGFSDVPRTIAKPTSQTMPICTPLSVSLSSISTVPLRRDLGGRLGGCE
jgi:hypothetical protein